MVSLSIADSGPVVVNGLTVVGPVTLEGETFSVLGETLTSGCWLVGRSSSELQLIQTAPAHPLVGLVALPLCLVLGMAVALVNFKFSK